MSKNIYIILKAKNLLSNKISNKSEVVTVIKQLQAIPRDTFEGSVVNSLIEKLKERYKI